MREIALWLIPHSAAQTLTSICRPRSVVTYTNGGDAMQGWVILYEAIPETLCVLGSGLRDTGVYSAGPAEKAAATPAAGATIGWASLLSAGRAFLVS
jgi:hypothetical protein